MHYILTIKGILIFLFVPILLSGQCLMNTLQSTGYMTGQCGNYSFQSAAGSLYHSSGSCAGLVFTPPLTGSDFTSQTIIYEPLNIKIFPNPAFDILHIQGLHHQDEYSAEILSATGQCVIKTILTNPNTLLDISDLSPGLYFVRLYNPDIKTTIQKFIKI